MRGLVAHRGAIRRCSGCLLIWGGIGGHVEVTCPRERRPSLQITMAILKREWEPRELGKIPSKVPPPQTGAQYQNQAPSPEAYWQSFKMINCRRLPSWSSVSSGRRFFTRTSDFLLCTEYCLQKVPVTKPPCTPAAPRGNSAAAPAKPSEKSLDALKPVLVIHPELTRSPRYPRVSYL